MLERTQLGFNHDELVNDSQIITSGLFRTEDQVWVKDSVGEFIGLTHIPLRISRCNEDHPYRDINTPLSSDFTVESHPYGQYELARSILDSETGLVYRRVSGVIESPFSVGRMRYVKVPARTTQPLHRDNGFSYYVAIDTNPLVLFMVNGGDGLPKRVKEGNLPMVRTYSLANDGHAYIVDGNRYYAIANTGNIDAFFLQIETNRVHREKPEWTGLTAERMTGNENVLDGKLPDATIFKSVDL